MALQARTLEAMVAENDRLVEALLADVGFGRRTADDARIERYRQLFAFAAATDVHAAAAAELLAPQLVEWHSPIHKETQMNEDPRCCGRGVCIVDNEGRCWCGQRWDGNKMCPAVLGKQAEAPAPMEKEADR